MSLNAFLKNMITENDVLNSLRKIIDPDFNRDIVSLGFVQNIKIHQDMVSLDIALTTPACPVKTEFQRQAEEAILKLPGIKHTNVNMTSQAPQTRGMPGIPQSTLTDV